MATKMREYLKITCKEGEKNRKPVGVRTSFGDQVRTLAVPDQLTAIFPVVEGTSAWVAFMWQHKAARVMVDWFHGEPAPKPLGRFDLLMDRYDVEPSNIIDRRICECTKQAGGSCADYIGVADDDCQSYYGNCSQLLGCATGKVRPTCTQPYIPSGPDGRCYLPCDAYDACPVGARCETSASPKYCIADDDPVQKEKLFRRDDNPELPNDGAFLPVVTSVADKCPDEKDWDTRGVDVHFNGHQRWTIKALDGWVLVSYVLFPKFRTEKGTVVKVKPKDEMGDARCIRYGDASLLLGDRADERRLTITPRQAGAHLIRLTTLRHGVNTEYFLNRKKTPPWDQPEAK